jgi:hypothetical protein
MSRTPLDPWTFLWSIARADRLEQVDALWPRLALARRELFTICRDGDHTAELRRLTAAAEKSPVLDAGRRAMVLEVLAEAFARPRLRLIGREK